MTNPLTQSDVVDNLSSTSTTAPLSANQGKVLNDSLSGKAPWDLNAPTTTLLLPTIGSADEKTATPVHWDGSIGFPYIYIDGVKHYLIRKADVRNSLDDANGQVPLSAYQGYIMSRDISWYGTSSTAASTIAKTATTSDSKFALTTGAKVSIKFTYNNTASAPTLNVDSTGAKSIKAYGTTAPTSWWKAGDVVTFTYDGTNWIMGATEGQINQINSDLSNNIIYFKDYYMTFNINAGEIQRFNVATNLGSISNVLGVEIIGGIDSDWINPILATCTTSSFKYLLQNLNPNTAKSGTATARLFYQK